VCYTYGVFALKKYWFCSDEVFQTYYKHSFSHHFQAHLEFSGAILPSLLGKEKKQKKTTKQFLNSECN
jgi:hypothetical protein